MFPQSRLRRLLPYLGERYQLDDRPPVEGGRDYDPGGLDRFNKQSGYLQRMFPTAGEALENEQTPIGGSSTRMPPVALRAIQPVSAPQTTPEFNPNNYVPQQWMDTQSSLARPTNTPETEMTRPRTTTPLRAIRPEIDPNDAVSIANEPNPARYKYLTGMDEPLEASTEPPTDEVQLKRAVDYTPIRYIDGQERGVNEQGRRRIAHPLEFQKEKYEDALTAPPEHTGTLSRFFKGGLRALPAGLQSGGLGGGLGAFLAGGTGSAIGRKHYENQMRDERANEEGQKLASMYGLERTGLQNDSLRANTEYTRAVKPALAQSTIDKNRAGIRQGDRRLDIQFARDAVRAKNESARLRLSEQSFKNLSAYREQLVRKMEREGLQKDRALDLEAQRISEIIRDNNTDNERDRQRTAQGWENAETSRARAVRDADNSALIDELDGLADEAQAMADTAVKNEDGAGQRTYQAKAYTLREKAARERAKANQPWPGQGSRQNPQGLSPQGGAQGTQGSVEAQIRADASAAGLDPEEAVRRAKTKGIIK